MENLITRPILCLNCGHVSYQRMCCFNLALQPPLVPHRFSWKPSFYSRSFLAYVIKNFNHEKRITTFIN